MIESVLRAHLTSALELPVLLEEPDGTRPERYLILQRTGGSQREHIRSSTIAIQCYAGSLYEAAALCEEVIAAMERLSAHPEVSGCSLNSSYNYTNTTKHQYRYQAVYNITHY